MQFNRLRLNGFKSFVDPTELIIADGLTGIVGPNGCGKSNLLEALRWVMGENRPSAMRGDGMEDVIFAGTASRSARNYAEVSIQIDNSERLAPQGFNDSDLLEVARRITREAGSAFKANSKDVRARDVQMLFADASTGAHSPALVRQGQIVELINAKPRARRRILEEAAGIAGLYQRRHEAELKLKAAEGNLSRVDDVLEQLAAQLAQLARQARQAARYREISEGLRRMEGRLLLRRWAEADAANIESGRRLAEAQTAGSEAERDARAAAESRDGAEAALPSLREENAIAGAVRQRLAVELAGLDEAEAQVQEAINTLTARRDHLIADKERELALDRDATDTIASLRSEAEELMIAGEGHAEALEDAAEEARSAAAVLQDGESRLAELTEDAARLAARHQSAQRLLDDARAAVKRAERDADGARSQIQETEEKARMAATQVEVARRVESEATAATKAAEVRLAEADTAREDAQAREAEARAARSAADGEVQALRSEAAALERLVSRDTDDAGQILDAMNVEPGFERAVGAALADDLRAPKIDALGRSGWALLPPYADTAPLPGGTRQLSEVVNGPDVLSRRLSQIGVVAAADGPRLQRDLRPGQRLVSEDGDLWRWDGFRAGAADAPSAAALRLEQQNRLEELRRMLGDLTARAEEATAAHDTLVERLATTSAADKEARETRRAADVALTDASRALARAEAEAGLVSGRLETLGDSLRRQEDEASGARARVTEAESALTDLGDLENARETIEKVKSAVEAQRLTMLARRSFHDDVRREGEARAKRLTEVERAVQDWTERLANASDRLAELAERQAATEADLALAEARPAEIAERRTALSTQIDDAVTRERAATNALAEGEIKYAEAQAAERKADRAASDAREVIARSEAQAEATQAALASARSRIADDLETTPEALAEQIGEDTEERPLAAERIEAEVARLRRQREALGAVNLRAEEDAKMVQAEHDTLTGEKADLEEAIRTLRGGIQSLNREGRERLLTAFEQVNANFSTLFTHLFGGGEAKLVMVESDDPLEAGLEIMCQPPGKRLSTLSLLSGGEQTLTALALIFAVFLANPAPICVLDEVDAPLDDANVARFCDLLDEMTRRTQTRFMIITHHALTMARMDRLFGVTMAELGVSQLVSVDLRKAEAMVA
ncbi:MAG: chromosome segregation protein SMC [Pseudomonadota bacterium]